MIICHDADDDSAGDDHGGEDGGHFDGWHANHEPARSQCRAMLSAGAREAPKPLAGLL